jgi:hypothetical protein
MSNLHKARTLFTLLILCMVSVWIAPIFIGIGTPVVEFTETDPDLFEFEEDFYLGSHSTGGMIHPMNLRTVAAHLHKHPASLARVFPPPRPFCS